jgi:hypothetical protein
MPNFIQTSSGSFVNADDVERISSADDDKDACRIVLRSRDGQDPLAFRVWERATELAQRLGYQYVAAQPGYAVVHSYSPKLTPDWTIEDFKRWQTPVVAWRFSSDENWPTPITADGPWDGGTSDTHVLVHPNGSVVHLGNRSWESLDEAYASQKNPDES